jgi:hypothetical protein
MPSTYGSIRLRRYEHEVTATEVLKAINALIIKQENAANERKKRNLLDPTAPPPLPPCECDFSRQYCDKGVGYPLRNLASLRKYLCCDPTTFPDSVKEMYKKICCFGDCALCKMTELSLFRCPRSDDNWSMGSCYCS